MEHPEAPKPQLDEVLDDFDEDDFDYDFDDDFEEETDEEIGELESLHDEDVAIYPVDSMHLPWNDDESS